MKKEIVGLPDLISKKKEENVVAINYLLNSSNTVPFYDLKTTKVAESIMLIGDTNADCTRP